MPHLPYLQWDFADRLHEVTLDANNNKAYYAYNSGGERTRKVVVKGNTTEERIYFGDYEIYRKTINQQLDFERHTHHVNDDTKKVALTEYKTVENGLSLQIPVVTVRYQYDNHLGSACLELDESAQLITYEEYHPFGTSSYRAGRSLTETSLKRYKYVGKERDEETGLYYYGMRYYADWLCRFVSVDPLQFKYPYYTPFQYAGNKPVSFIDLDGGEEKKKEEEPKKQEIKTNFYIKEGDTDAVNDVLNLPENKDKNSKYIKISEKGEVSLDFSGLSKHKVNKIIRKDEGIKLINDLISAKDKKGNDIRTYYQTTGPFNFSGYKEGKALGAFPKVVPNDWANHRSGETSDENNVKQFNYTASITTYGVDSKGKINSTLLPKSGFQSQVAIAMGNLELNKTTWEIEITEKYDPVSKKQTTIKEHIPKNEKSYDRTKLVMHELRESLYRSQDGKSYNDAHNATIRLYGDWQVIKFTWK